MKCPHFMRASINFFEMCAKQRCFIFGGEQPKLVKLQTKDKFESLKLN